MTVVRRVVVPALMVASLLSACGVVFPEKRDWAFVQAVGGIAVDAPQVDGRTLTLPVRADVSGLHAITTPPTTLNSALICPATYAKVQDHDILVTITTGLVTAENHSTACPPATLRAPAAGKYQVLYGDQREGAVPLGEITIVR